MLSLCSIFQHLNLIFPQFLAIDADQPKHFQLKDPNLDHPLGKKYTSRYSGVLSARI